MTSLPFLDEKKNNYWIDCSDNLPLRQDPASDERPGLRQTLGRTSCLRIFILNLGSLSVLHI